MVVKPHTVAMIQTPSGVYWGAYRTLTFLNFFELHLKKYRCTKDVPKYMYVRMNGVHSLTLYSLPLTCQSLLKERKGLETKAVLGNL